MKIRIQIVRPHTANPTNCKLLRTLQQCAGLESGVWSLFFGSKAATVSVARTSRSQAANRAHQPNPKGSHISHSKHSSFP